MLTRTACLLIILLISVTGGVARAQNEENPTIKAQALAREVEAKVSELRGLKYLNPTKVGVYTKEALQAFLTEEMAKELTPEIADQHERSLVQFGFFERDIDLRKMALKLLSDQIAGFYNPEKKELFLIQRTGDDLDAAAMDKIIMTHELDHALQDQHFDLANFLKAVEDNDDMMLARKSLVEGDATWAMTAFEHGVSQTAMILGPMMPDSIAGMKPLLEMAKKMGVKDAGGGPLNTDSLFEAPMIVGDEMIFSYYGGAKFCSQIMKNEGTKAIDAAFRRPPQSTEQILHPKKYLAEYDSPQAITLPSLSHVLGKGYEEIRGNTLGEMRIRTWLTQHGIKKKQRTAAHKGWDGDTYSVYGGEGRSDVLVWVSEWDSAEDASEFAGVAKEILNQMESNSETKPGLLVQCGRASQVSQKGTRVYFLRGVPLHKWDQVHAQLEEKSQVRDQRYAEDGMKK